MRLSSDDIVPIIVVLAGGAFGVVAAGALVLRSAAPEPAAIDRIVVEREAEPAAQPVLRASAVTPAEAIERIDRLLLKQREVRDGVATLAVQWTADRAPLVERLRPDKDLMHEDVAMLEEDLDRSAHASRADPDAAMAFRVAAELIRVSKLKEAIRYSRGTIEQWDAQSALTMEFDIEGRLRDVREALVKAAPTFTPFTVAPSVLNRDEVVRAMRAAYPGHLRDAGAGGTVRVYFLIDEAGGVERTAIDQSSGVRELDEAALSVANVYRFEPARNRDRRVVVWVSFPITFRVR